MSDALRIIYIGLLLLLALAIILCILALLGVPAAILVLSLFAKG